MSFRTLARFVAIAAVLMSLFFVASSTEAYQSGVGRPYLEWTAHAAAGLLRLVSVRSVTTQGNFLAADGFSLRVDRGCDASTECALFTALVLSFPAALGRKLAAVGLGVAVLVAVNVVRVASLALAGAHAPALFERLHVEVWQAAIMMLAVSLWAAWFGWAIHSPRVRESAG